MRKYIVLAFLLYFSGANGQIRTTGLSNLIANEVESRYDTTVIYEGVNTIEHQHDWVIKDVRDGMFSSDEVSCLVWHGATGCPDKWMNNDEICKICLRKMNVRESRYVVEPPKDDYELLDSLVTKRLQY